MLRSLSRQLPVDWQPFAMLYVITCFIYYLATWWGYGGFSGGHPPIYDLEEFFASSGLKFGIYLFVSVFLVINGKYFTQINPWLLALLGGVVFLIVTSLLQELVLGFFGYVQFFGGKLSVFNYLITASFFVFQALLFLLLTERRRVRGAIVEHQPSGETVGKTQTLVKTVVETEDKVFLIFGSRGKTRVPLNVDNISRITARRNYATAHTITGNYLLDFGIGKAERRLSQQGFIRVHRSYLINLNHLEYIKREGRAHLLVMSDDARISVGAKYLMALRDMGY